MKLLRTCYLHVRTCVHMLCSLVVCIVLVQILTSVCWQGNGKCFGCSYSDGTVVLWNPKIEGKPEKIFSLHGGSVLSALLC